MLARQRKLNLSCIRGFPEPDSETKFEFALFLCLRENVNNKKIM